VELDLSQWKGLVPVELFSSNEMPAIGDNPYFLTLGPHAFYWFAMQPRAVPSIQSDGTQVAAVLPEVRVAGGWEAALVGRAKERFESVLLGYIQQRRWFGGKARRLKTATTRAFARLRGPETVRLEAQLSVAEQSNNSVIFGERLMLKVFRRLEEGVNPELEVGRFLTEKTNFSQIAPLAGSLEYRRGEGEPVSIAILQGYVPNQGDAWQFTLNTLAHYFNGPELVGLQAPPVPRSLIDASRQEPGEIAVKAIGGYLESARLLGRRTGEMHAALSSDPTDPAFAP